MTSRDIERPATYEAAAVPGALLASLRLRQSTKNLFVYAAIVFAGKLLDGRLLFRVTLAFVLFTFVSGAIYLFNDLIDVEQDRAHPTKRDRPIASGRLPASTAWVAIAMLGGGGVAESFLVRPKFGIVVASYLVLQIAYSLLLKRLVLIDVFAIAAGFVLRAVAGGMVIDVGLSQWLLLCTLMLALFLGFGKRRQELVLMGAGAGGHRAILQEYSLPFLDQMMNIVSGVTIVCYSVYTVESATARSHPHLWITVPFVVYAVFRYLYLVHQKGWGGAPDEVLLRDRPLQAAMALWFVAVMLLFAFDSATRPLIGWG